MKENILEYSVDAYSVDECADILFSSLRRSDGPGGCAWLACLNPHSYAAARHDAVFSRALKDANWLAPDGAGIVLA